MLFDYSVPLNKPHHIKYRLYPEFEVSYSNPPFQSKPQYFQDTF